MKKHDVITLIEFGEKTVSSRIGTLLETRKDGCYKLVLDYRPASPDAPILVIVDNNEGEERNSIFSGDWVFDSNVKSHSIYGYTPYRESGKGKDIKKQKNRIGTMFRTKTDHVYSLVLNLWPVSGETDILCFEIDAEEMFSDRT